MNNTHTYRIGIVGISGNGGGEALRLCASHPNFRVVYAAGETSAGQKLVSGFPGLLTRVTPRILSDHTSASPYVHPSTKRWSPPMSTMRVAADTRGG